MTTNYLFIRILYAAYVYKLCMYENRLSVLGVHQINRKKIIIRTNEMQ